MQIFRSLQYRYGFYATGIIISVAIILGAVLFVQYKGTFQDFFSNSQNTTKEYLLKQVEQQGFSLSAILAENLKNPLYEMNMKKMQHIINAAKESNSVLNVVGSVNSLIVYDSEGKIIHDGQATMPNFGQVIVNDPVNSITNLKHPVTELLQSSLKIWRTIRIDDLVIGGVVIELSLDTVNNNLLQLTNEQAAQYNLAQKNIVLLVLTTTAILIFIGVIISVLAAKQIVKPIKEVAEVANSMSHENYNQKLSYQYKDEIGELVDSFNNMNDRLSQEVIEREHVQQQLKHMALFDSLTNLPNRTLIMDRLQSMISHASRHQTLIAVIFIDLDDFKKVNDTLGHNIGDELLIKLAKRLETVLRPQDSVGRLGGDEFIILLDEIEDINYSSRVAERLMEVYRKPFLIGGRNLVMTASAGISIYPDDGDELLELLQKSDSAMYHSKSIGRNTYSYYSSKMNDSLIRRVAIEEQMHQAIEKNEYSVYYQPKIKLLDDSIVGVEALLRWKNIDLGEILPDEFIPIAEQTGHIDELGDYVFMQAVDDITALNIANESQLSVAINVSPRQLRQDNFIEYIQKHPPFSKCINFKVELEITEGVLMSGIPNIKERLNKMISSGFKLAMDDFGKGYSSLSYLSQYPFEILKIDRSFVKKIAENKDECAVIKAIVAMSHSLGIEVVAEGVETAKQAEFLKRIGCDYAQGFYYSRPMPADELKALLSLSKHRFTI